MFLYFLWRKNLGNTLLYACSLRKSKILEITQKVFVCVISRILDYSQKKGHIEVFHCSQCLIYRFLEYSQKKGHKEVFHSIKHLKSGNLKNLDIVQYTANIQSYIHVISHNIFIMQPHWMSDSFQLNLSKWPSNFSLIHFYKRCVSLSGSSFEPHQCHCFRITSKKGHKETVFNLQILRLFSKK